MMAFLFLQKSLRILIYFPFALFLLLLTALASCLGSIVEQNESLSFYKENYPTAKAFLNYKTIYALALDHVFQSWWFFLLLFTLFLSLTCCTFVRQFPLFSRSKALLFKQKKQTFGSLPFFAQPQKALYSKEKLSFNLYCLEFTLYQKANIIYGYRGLLGRISPIFVHLSLLAILIASSIGALKSFQGQELLPKGEVLHIQNVTSSGPASFFSYIAPRANDFWVEYEKGQTKQFYSNLSFLTSFGEEIQEQTISVNHPLQKSQVSFYQGDWNFLSIRIQTGNDKPYQEFPLFSFQKDSKSFITFISIVEKAYIVLFDQLQSKVFIYNSKGRFLSMNAIGDSINSEGLLADILPATGLLVKYDPSIPLMYFGFGVLMTTTFLSYLPYTQIWLLDYKKKLWLGGLTNRGKDQLEIQLLYLTKKTKV